MADAVTKTYLPEENDRLCRPVRCHRDWAGVMSRLLRTSAISVSATAAVLQDLAFGASCDLNEVMEPARDSTIPYLGFETHQSESDVS